MAVFPAFAIGIALSACAEEPVNEFRYDRYSGVPVMTQKMAEAIMLHRHVNAPIVGERAPDGQLIDAVTGESKTLYQVIQDKPMVLSSAVPPAPIWICIWRTSKRSWSGFNVASIFR